MAGKQAAGEVGFNEHGGSMVSREALEKLVENRGKSKIEVDESGPVGVQKDTQAKDSQPEKPKAREMWRERNKETFSLSHLLLEGYCQDEFSVGKNKEIRLVMRTLNTEQIMTIQEECMKPEISAKAYIDTVNLHKLAYSICEFNGVIYDNQKDEESYKRVLKEVLWRKSMTFVNFLLNEYFELEADVSVLLSKENLKN